MSSDVLCIYCSTCAKGKPKHKSISEFSKIEVARTPYGILIWCMRCDKEVAHFPYNFAEIDKAHPNVCQCEGCKNQ